MSRDRKNSILNILEFLWQFIARTFLFLAGLIMITYGYVGLVGGKVLPAAGRSFGEGYTFPKTATGSPEYLTGLGARLYGLMFVALGCVLIFLATWSLLKRLNKKLRNRGNEDV